MQMTAASIYGTQPQAPSWGVQAPTGMMGTDDFATGWRAFVDPHNPVVWLGAILAATVGLAAVAGSARVGPVRVGAGVGKV